MARSIICGVDGSQSAKGAARVARGLAAELGLGLIFVRVVEPDAPDQEATAIAARLELLRTRANGADSGADWIIEVGHTGDRLLAAAARTDAVMIVVGATATRPPLLGSVSAYVFRHAACPVVIVPTGADRRFSRPARRREAIRGGHQFAGGIARFRIGGGDTGVAGSIVRFGLGSGSTET